MTSWQNEFPVFISKCSISNQLNSLLKCYSPFVLNVLSVKMEPFVAAERQRKSILGLQIVENVQDDVVNK